MLRSLHRPQAAGFRRSVAASTHQVSVVTPAGIYLGKRAAYDVDLLRVERVLGRIVWGLFLHHFGRRLPDDYVAAVYCVTQLRAAGQLEEVA
jgi:hypothetical protein